MNLLGVALITVAGILAAAALLDLRRRTETDRNPRDREAETPAAALSLGLPDLIRRAGRSEDLTPRSLLAAKALTAATGLCLGTILAAQLPGRLGTPVLAGMACLGFLLPDLSLERVARRRHRRMVAALPDALDLLAVSVATGRPVAAGLLELGEAGRGPLAGEFALTGSDMAWGAGQQAALDSLRARVSGGEMASFCATLERSRKLGSPLADQLRRQASTLRQDQRRSIEEEAARAAPKIQLVIALVLVPSVLLLMVAALIANSDALLGIGYAAWVNPVA
ncbi:MAG: type II secretion system F family protein [Solirubrobacterales bacterium]